MNRTLFLASFLATVSLFGQAKPDLSGTWKLNVDKSDFGPLPPPTSRTEVITESDAQLKAVVSEQSANGPVNMNMVYNTDGSETTNKLLGQDVKSTGKWDGGGFVVHTTNLKYQDQDVVIDAKFTVGSDGKSLTEAIHYASPMGEADQTLVFEKQTGAAPAAPTPAPAPVPSAAPVISGAHPNFSGTWKLNVAKSDFGPIPGPESRIEKIDHKEPAIKDSFDAKGGPQGDQSGELDFTTDGKPATNTVSGLDIKGSANWDGAALVLDNALSVQGQDITIKSRWNLSTDGKVLTEAAHITYPSGEADVTYVYEKQPD